MGRKCPSCQKKGVEVLLTLKLALFAVRLYSAVRAHVICLGDANIKIANTSHLLRMQM